MLVTLWGDVPLVTESTSIPRTDYTRNAVAEVDGVIDSDLVYAMSNLPVVGAAKNESRINQDMARQLAGEAYLRMGMRDATYFKKAEDAVTPIITGRKYELNSARYGMRPSRVIIIMICSVGGISVVHRGIWRLSGLSKWSITVM